VVSLHVDLQLGHHVQLSDSIPRAFDANTPSARTSLKFEELVLEVYCTLLLNWSQEDLRLDKRSS
jgi:hypothetical protein